MATFIGKIDPFDEAVEPWPCYKERLDQYFIVNEIGDAKKVAALLSLVGSQTYRLLRDLTAPDLPSTKDYAAICGFIQKHYAPKPLIIAERFRFYKRDQKGDESIKDFNVALRKLSEYCEFGTVLNDALRDRFVCGLRSEATQKKLLAERDLTYERAIDLAIAMEAASKDVVQFQGKQDDSKIGVHKLKMQKTQSKWKNKPRQQQSGQVGQRNASSAPQFKPSSKWTSGPSKKQYKPCYRCLRTNHSPDECGFKSSTCYSCGKKGHIAPACKPGGKLREKVHTLSLDDSSDYEQEYLYSLTEKNSRNVIWVSPQVNKVDLNMELDTGSGISVISKLDYQKYFSECQLKETNLQLKTYSGEIIKPIGSIECNVHLNDQSAVLDLYVLENDGRPLFGREWLRQLKLNWSEIKTLSTVSGKLSHEVEVEKMRMKHKEVFSDELGKLKNVKAKLVVNDENPKFVKARTVPYSMKAEIDKELDYLLDQGVIEQVSHSEWATPIVPVPKESGDIRICGDYKVTVNPLLDIDQYPLPRIEDIFASLSGGQHYSKIDLKNAYLQIEMEDESKKYLTISTHRGLFRYNRLVFGIASSPAIFQRTIEQVMQGVPGTQVILDDMIVTGKSDEDHLRNLDLALKRLKDYGLRANPKKCEFFKDQVTFCGHVIDKEGLHKSQSKIDAVVNAPKIENVGQLRSFLGLVSYYGKFLPDMATILQPLHELLEKNRKWKWTKKCSNAVAEIKQMITSDLVLTHYNPDLPVTLACDASSYGLGCVLSHIMPDGEEKPIAFASRSLNPAEKNYSQIDKEALGIVWGVKKFHLYLYGKKFTLITDHKPLLTILSPNKGINGTTAARLQRYALFLAGHSYEIKYKDTKSHGNCDSLSRLPVKSETDNYKLDSTDIFYISQFEKLPVTAKDVQIATARDRVLARVYDSVSRGWTVNTDTELEPYFNRRNELWLHQGCVVWGWRILIPEKLRSCFLEELHEGHLGVVKVKALARSYVWWPKLDKDIENLTKSCVGCQKIKNNPPEAPIHPWEYPSKPWNRIHIDFAGPFLDSMFLIIVDAFSKWPVVKQMRKTTASQTIEVLRTVFSDYGIPRQIVSDNGPQFVSEEFQTFLKMNGVKQILSAPYHPKTNGLAERFVQSFKLGMKAAKNDPGTVQTKLSKFLLAYRNTPHSTTKESPATLLMGRHLTTRLDLVKPNLHETVSKSHQKMVRSTRDRDFELGQTVSVRDYRSDHDKWIPGIVNQKTGPVSYRVEIAPNVLWKRHADQLRDSEWSKGDSGINVELPSYSQSKVIPEIKETDPSQVKTPVTAPSQVKTPVKEVVQPSPVQERRYPVRDRRKPKRLDL